MAKPESKGREQVGGTLIVISLVLTLVTSAINFLRGLVESTDIAYAVGSGIGNIVFSSLVVLLLQMIPRFRNLKSRVKIYTWCMLFLFVSAIYQLTQFVNTGSF